MAAAISVRNRGRNQRQNNTGKGRSLTKFGRVCFLLNKGSPTVYMSHNITTCNKLSDRDKQEMVRHAALTLDVDSDQDSPTPIPGWDLDD